LISIFVAAQFLFALATNPEGLDVFYRRVEVEETGLIIETEQTLEGLFGKSFTETCCIRIAQDVEIVFNVIITPICNVVIGDEVRTFFFSVIFTLTSTPIADHCRFLVLFR
jgi:hypothetical protein